MVVPTIPAIVSVSGAFIMYALRCIFIKQDPKRGRKMSTMSSVLSHGAMPRVSSGNPHYSITICGFTKQLPDVEALKTLVKEKLLPYKRFRSIPNGSFWTEVEVDINNHINEITTDNQEKLKEQIEKIMNTPIPLEFPRWEFFLLTNAAASQLNNATEKNQNSHCVIIRVDHCLGDGIALVEVLGKILTDIDGNELSAEELSGLKRTTSVRKTEKAMLHNSFFVTRCAKHFYRHLCTGMKICRGAINTLAMGFGAYDSSTPLNVSLCERKTKGIQFSSEQKATTGGPWSLDYVKAIKNKLGVSVNDIFMASFAGAVRRYCQDISDKGSLPSPNSKKPEEEIGLMHNISTEPILFRALMAYAFIRDTSVYRDVDRALSNKWTLISTKFAVNEPNVLQRVFRTRQITEAMKRSFQPIATVMVNTIGNKILPRSVMQHATWQTYCRHSCVFSNVPASPVKIRVCGSLIDEIQVLFPNVLPQIELVTYAGRIFFSLVADRKVITQPDRLLQYFVDDLRELGQHVGINGISLDIDPNSSETDLPQTMSST